MPALPHPLRLTRLTFGLLTLLSGLPLAQAQQAPDAPPATTDARPPDVGLVPEALRALQHFVGRWRGVGQPRRGSPAGAWQEEAEWSWRFEPRPALEFRSPQGKYFRRGRLTAGEPAGHYQLEAHTTAAQQPVVYRGRLEEPGAALVLTCDNPPGDGPHVVSLRLIANGNRLVVLYQRQAAGQQRTRLAEVGYTREGSRFGQGSSQTECVVTGGLGTIAVTYQGLTYHVCCTGCRDYFNEHPEEVLREYRERQAQRRESQPGVAAAIQPPDGGPADVASNQRSYRAVVVEGTQAPPAGWTRKSSRQVADGQTAAIGRKLGGRISKLWNTEFTVTGQRWAESVALRVNVLDCSSADDAAKIEAALRKVHGNPAFVLRDGNTLVELVCNDIRTALRAPYFLGLKPSVANYRVTFRAAPLASCDYMAWNRMFNLFLQLERKQPDASAAIQELSGKFTFGRELRFRRHGLGSQLSTFELQPRPQSESVAGGDVVTYAWTDLPLSETIPAVRVVAEVRSETFAVTATDRRAGPELLAATQFWPSDDAGVKQLASDIVGQRTTVSDKTDALLDWLMPGQNVRYGGQITGSRYGTRQVLRQKFGHCWDFSDCFVTLARAAGVPCRQVGGWLVGQSGHVWAEVLVEGQGWLQVDPSAGLQCTAEYVPYIVSEDGAWPLVYTSDVEIRTLP
ncbi:MAG: hypothetical protein J5I93_01405 [Pirellulaceae bacterium]|nr:hypothetical protein [Pirellulaceae bacterium]